MPLQQFDERVIEWDSQIWDDTYTPGAWQGITSNVNADQRRDLLIACNTDVIDHNLAVSLRNDDTEILFIALLPAGCGTGGIPPVDVFGTMLPASLQFILLNAGGSLQGDIREAITATKQVTTYCQGGAF